MSSCSLVIVHASLKNMVSRKTRLKFLVPKTGGRTWRDKKIHDFHNFSNSGLKLYMRISECICNRIMIKKIDFLTHLQEKLKWIRSFFRNYVNFLNFLYDSKKIVEFGKSNKLRILGIFWVIQITVLQLQTCISLWK